MKSNLNFGLSDSVIEAARQSMKQGSVPLTMVEAEIAKRTGTTPKTAKEKSLAALAEPKNKITHRDVMVGRGVAKEDVEQVDEISKKTAQEYLKKTVDPVEGMPRSGFKDLKTRLKGIQRASKIVTKTR